MSLTVDSPGTPAPSSAPAPRRSWRRAFSPPVGGVGPVGLGVATLWLSLIVLLPLAAVATKSFEKGPDGFWDAVTAPSAKSALTFTLGVSVLVALINVVVGTLIAWVLVRDEFPGKGVVNALIDLPFALPTIVASIVLLSLYGPRSPINVNLVATKPAVVLALLFVTLPFVVRTVQPVLMELDAEAEEAAASLGASNVVIFRRVLLPALAPALLSGAGLAFARAIGEFGSVVLIGGGIPRDTEVASQYIATQIEVDRPVNAAAVSVALLAISFLVLLVLRVVGARAARRH
ncbi:sulfate ABC transporter permease subunit CysT [Sporichthya brevicatena]|uniref:sulfate ABC transporter permease subunit CysT n=1 Tax=Sporichthya brevicatena TaxID=171442 RepID=UPI003CD0ACF3